MDTPFPPELAAVVLTFIGAVIALLMGNDTLAVRKGDAAARRLAKGARERTGRGGRILPDWPFGLYRGPAPLTRGRNSPHWGAVI